MPKVLHCRADNSLHSLHPDGSATTCDCQRCHAWYIDADLGTCVTHTPNPEDRPLLHVISIHNGFLNEGPLFIPTTYFDANLQQHVAYAEPQLDIFWRQLHLQAGLAPKAPETVRVFDASRRACPFAILTPGTAADVQWATPEQCRLIAVHS
jgi:hypothetical protein